MVLLTCRLAVMTSGQECGLVNISFGSADLSKCVVFLIFHFAVFLPLFSRQECGLGSVQTSFCSLPLFRSVVLFKPRLAVFTTVQECGLIQTSFCSVYHSSRVWSCSNLVLQFYCSRVWSCFNLVLQCLPLFKSVVLF